MSPQTGSAAPSDRIDKACALLCALIPVGVVFGTVVFEFFVCLTGALWLGRCVIGKHNPLETFKSDWLWIAFFVFNLSIYLGVLANGPGDKGLLNDLAFLRFFILVTAMIDISKRVPIEKYLVLGLLSAVALGALNTLSAHTLGFDLVGKSVARYSAKGAEAKRIAGVCTYAGSFFLAWSVFDRQLKTKPKALLLFTALICAPLVFKTGIRTLMLSLTFAAVWVLFLFIKRRVSKVLALVLVLAAIAGSVLIVKNGNIGLSSFWDRFHIWKVNYAMWQKQPLFGVGPFAYRSEYREAMAKAEPGEFAFKAPDGTIYNHPEITFHSHNLVMMIVASTGLVGILSFFWLFFLCCRTIVNHGGGWRDGLRTWPVILMVVGMAGYNIYDPWYQSLFTFFLILIGSARREPVLPSINLFDIMKKKTLSETIC